MHARCRQNTDPISLEPLGLHFIQLPSGYCISYTTLGKYILRNNLIKDPMTNIALPETWKRNAKLRFVEYFLDQLHVYLADQYPHNADQIHIVYLVARERGGYNHESLRSQLSEILGGQDHLLSAVNAIKREYI
jgi:hypothetical protein